jgi:gamma-aminobutyric acid type B receptor
MFWKAILLMLGLYISFLIRNVSVDFQESPWIFGSVVVVLVGCLLILPMSYMVDIRASTYYVFLATCLIICTNLIMALMLLPKLARLNEVASTTSSVIGSAKSRSSVVVANPVSSNGTETENNNTSLDAGRRPSQKYRVKSLTNDKKPNNNSPSADPGTSTTNYK